MTATGPPEAGSQDARCAVELAVLKLQLPPPGLRLTVSPAVELDQGSRNSFGVNVARDRWQGPVTLRADALPKGLTIDPVTIPDDQTEAALEIRAARDAVARTEEVTLLATAPAPAISRKAGFQVVIHEVIRPKVDVLFVLDVTGSMGFAISGICRGIGDFAGKLDLNRLDARVGLIAFRDRFLGEEPEILAVDGETFTSDYEAFRRKVSELKADGGGDEPESSLDALALATAQKFRSDATKVLLLITDAPPKIPDKQTESIDEIVEQLKRHEFQQLHLVVRTLHRDSYTKLQRGARGEFFDISEAAGNADAFARIMPTLSGEIARTTIASLPPQPLPPEALPPPPLAPAAEQASSTPPTPPPAPPLRGVQSQETFAPESSVRLVTAVAVWTGAIAAMICLALIAGQHFYLRQSLLPWGQAALGLGGGLVAGLAGGAFGQLLYFCFGSTPWMDAGGRLVGWALLGALVGLGMGCFVPNLRASRGLLGGTLGGAGGALAYLGVALVLPVQGEVLRTAASTSAVTQIAEPNALGIGNMLARCIGAGILGLCIALMVAVVEAVFREAWLEIHYGPGERKAFSLGKRPVTIGSGPDCTVYVARAPSRALRYTLEGGRILCAKGESPEATAVTPGQSEMVGSVRVVVCAARTRKSAPRGSASLTSHRKPSGVLRLHLATGKQYRLTLGEQLTAEQLPGLAPCAGSGNVAEVVSNPKYPAVWGLKNLSQVTWSATLPDGSRRQVEPGRSIQLQAGLKIDFGPLRGEVGDQGPG